MKKIMLLLSLFSTLYMHGTLNYPEKTALIEEIDHALKNGSEINASLRSRLEEEKLDVAAWATIYPYPEVLKFLLKEGLNPNQIKNNTGNPLIFTTIDETRNLLLDAGASINAQNTKGETLLHYIIDYISDRIYCDCECTGGRNIDTLIQRGEGIIQDMINRGADVNKVNHQGETPLMYAALRGFDSFVEVLLKHNANQDVRSNLDKTALDYADLGYLKTPFIYLAIEQEFYKRDTYIQCMKLLGRKNFTWFKLKNLFNTRRMM